VGSIYFFWRSWFGLEGVGELFSISVTPDRSTQSQQNIEVDDDAALKANGQGEHHTVCSHCNYHLVLNLVCSRTPKEKKRVKKISGWRFRFFISMHAPSV
jgi:hypothetical protein